MSFVGGRKATNWRYTDTDVTLSQNEVEIKRMVGEILSNIRVHIDIQIRSCKSGALLNVFGCNFIMLNGRFNIN